MEKDPEKQKDALRKEERGIKKLGTTQRRVKSVEAPRQIARRRKDQGKGDGQ